MARDVAKAEAPTLTTLLPIRMVLNNLWGSAFMVLIRRPMRSRLARWRALVLLMENSAVSAEEKNPESRSRTTSVMICSDIYIYNITAGAVGEAVRSRKR